MDGFIRKEEVVRNFRFASWGSKLNSSSTYLLLLSEFFGKRESETSFLELKSDLDDLGASRGSLIVSLGINISVPSLPTELRSGKEKSPSRSGHGCPIFVCLSLFFCFLVSLKEFFLFSMILKTISS